MLDMKVVGILLVRDEERFVEQAVRNVLGFCDEFIAVDNGSSDGTLGILEKLRAEFPEKIRLHRAAHPRESHDLIAGLAGSNTWVFAVDGDEIYDPAGLGKFRRRLEAGEFDGDWCVFGNVLNVRHLDPESGMAGGHLAPPCRSMTKLYNFSAIEAWHGPCLERLHGGRVVFKKGFHEKLRRDLHQSLDWEEAEFRCLHLCFIPRSSSDAKSVGPRRNIMDVYNTSLTKTLRSVLGRITAKPEIDWKEQRYGRGEAVVKPIVAFFPVKDRVA